ncbi:hypothetical protein H6A16_00320 [Collinsella tanakaei]|nr:hypothetical protein [Collinsella tanakaei]MBM6777951.1 hypothetical protein [Collinsella tanakaei]
MLKHISPIIILVAAATALMLGGCTVTDQSTEVTGSGVSAHVEFEF